MQKNAVNNPKADRKLKPLPTKEEDPHKKAKLSRHEKKSNKKQALERLREKQEITE